MTDKTSLRRELRRRRMAVPARQRRLVAFKVARRALRFLQPGQAIAAYVATGSELSLDILIQLARMRGCSVWLPVVPSRGRKMQFVDSADRTGIWRCNRYGIKEFISRHRCMPRQLATVFLPLVGFDMHGGRLGQGGGYYDATFAFRSQPAALRKPRMVGVAFDCQRVAHIHREPHDVCLDWVITETMTHRCVRPRQSS
ncbi:5-formyltetrahydrofolate cyclo-ligase [Chitinimonas sp. PSY-7]|uniref:5-formyltetrahydrofolate cyclo-ligase n=1 Tax=Chitinimonas sp. PSY-7 TaxID=3459088 RepID=UPI00403FDFEE